MALQLYCTPVGLRKCTVQILLLKTVIVCLKKRSFSVGLICIMLWKIRREAFLLVWSVFMLRKKAAWNSLCNGDGLPCWASRLAQAFAERSQCHALCCCVEHLWYAFFSWCKKPDEHNPNKWGKTPEWFENALQAILFLIFQVRECIINLCPLWILFLVQINIFSFECWRNNRWNSHILALQSTRDGLALLLLVIVMSFS